MLKLAGLGVLTLASALAAVGPNPAEAGHEKELVLQIPGRDLSVSFPSGVITSKGVSDPCLEAVTRSGSHELRLTRQIGDDQARVIKNGDRLPLGPDQAGFARTGSFRIARDGSVAYLRTWKSGHKRVELVQDGKVTTDWAPGSSVRLVRFSREALTMVVREPGKTGQLLQLDRKGAGGIDAASARVLYGFDRCLPTSIRPIGKGFLLDLPCRRDEAALFFLDPEHDTLSAALPAGPVASFAPLPKSDRLKRKVAVVTAVGTASALNFYHAVFGLLLGQTGEPKSCASDAEGLQSWNQSYRLLALAELYDKTAHTVFSRLATKSIANTLQTTNASVERQEADGPGCGWSSLVYSSTPGVPVTLMINQAMIANALADSCAALGKACSSSHEAKISELRLCLANHYDIQFDKDAGLYRISEPAAFRFAGKIAPWNWQVAFAALLSDFASSEERYQTRATDIISRFIQEWEETTDGALWRYWPNAYYMENGLTLEQVEAQRFEDTGHAGISLMSLAQFDAGQKTKLQDSVGRRLAAIIKQGPEPARDLDGKGPKSSRWFPATGWASYSYPGFAEAYAQLAGGSSSAKTVYTQAQLFHPDEPFELTLKVFACDRHCADLETHHFASAATFLANNPFFKITQVSGLQDEQPRAGN